VNFHGQELDQDLAFAQIGLLLITSSEETFCRPAAEAAVRGIPVICRYPLPAVEELLGSLAFYGDGSIDSMLDSIDGIAQQKYPVASPAECHARILGRHDVAAQHARLLAFWASQGSYARDRIFTLAVRSLKARWTNVRSKLLSLLGSR
jgi:hypothetical protein